MFTIDSSITNVKITEKKLRKVLFSMNIHQVANPDMSLEEARSYVFFFHEGQGLLSVLVGLYFLPSDRRLFYTYEGNPFAGQHLSEIEDEARRFAEDLGAMLDEVDFGQMSDQQQQNWIAEQEILSGRRKQEEPAQEPEAAAAEPPVSPVAPEPAATQEPQASVPHAQAAPSPPAPAVNAAPAPHAAPVQPPSQPQRPAAQPPVQQKQPVSPEAEEAPAPQRASDVLQKAVKAGVVKSPKAQLKKDIQTANGVVSRDREALARLLASF